MKFRERIIRVPDEMDKRAEALLQAMKDKDDRIPKDLGMTDFIALMLYPQGLAFLELAVKRSEESKRVVKLPDEVGPFIVTQ